MREAAAARPGLQRGGRPQALSGRGGGRRVGGRRVGVSGSRSRCTPNFPVARRRGGDAAGVGGLPGLRVPSVKASSAPSEPTSADRGSAHLVGGPPVPALKGSAGRPDAPQGSLGSQAVGVGRGAQPGGRGHTAPFSRPGVLENTEPPPRRLGSPGRLPLQNLVEVHGGGGEGETGAGRLPAGLPPQAGAGSW